MPIKSFTSDRLFIICFLCSFIPYIILFAGSAFSFDDIKHPIIYAIAVAFSAKYYVAAFIGFIMISVTTALLEESFFRGVLLRDYFGLSKYKQYALLIFVALYFAFCHLPLAFVFPFIFALIINRVRLAHKNLLPGMILHALWNANIVIVTLLLLNPTIPKQTKRTLGEEIKVATEIWKMKQLDHAQALFPRYKTKDKIHTFEGLHLHLTAMTDADDKKKRIGKLVE